MCLIVVLQNISVLLYIIWLLKKIRKFFPFPEKFWKMQLQPCCAEPTIWNLASFLEERRRLFTMYGHGGHFGHVTRTIWTNFHSLIPMRIHIKFAFDRPSGFRGQDVWKCWHTYGRQRPAYTIRSPMTYRLRWVNKIKNKIHLPTPPFS